MKFKTTIEFDCHWLDSKFNMAEVIFHVELAITDDDKIVSTNVEIKPNCIGYLEQLGGNGGPNYWKDQVVAHFEIEMNCAEGLIAAMTDEEFLEFQESLLGDWSQGDY